MASPAAKTRAMRRAASATRSAGRLERLTTTWPGPFRAEKRMA